jgi:hypothetical protein
VGKGSYDISCPIERKTPMPKPIHDMTEDEVLEEIGTYIPLADSRLVNDLPLIQRYLLDQNVFLSFYGKGSIRFEKHGYEVHESSSEPRDICRAALRMLRHLNGVKETTDAL